MTSRVETVQDAGLLGRARFQLGSLGFMAGAFAVDVLLIVCLAVLTGSGYHLAVYGTIGEIENYATVGALAALSYTLPFLFRNEYRIHDYLEGRRSFRRVFMVWNYAVLSLAVIGFLTKSTGIYSRGWLTVFYVAGLSGMTALSAITGALLGSLIDRGRLSCRRVMLVGSNDEVRRVGDIMIAARAGVRVVAMMALAGPADSDQDGVACTKQLLREAVERARTLHVDDVVLLADWSRDAQIHHIVSAFSALPVSIHLGASNLLGQFSDAHVSRLGAVTALSLTAPPLGPVQALAKRVFDVSVATVALVLLSPLFAAIALAVSLESPGPVFFRQRRRGYRSAEFRIWKFRTMSTLDDGDVIVQASANDARVTRVGRFLRRFNFDELPQLFNVFSGEMSLVGPRPHAVAHDKIFEQRILSYPRRLNVLPGITGWAQVNGHRGRTETDDAMRARVDCDLYYIDNWSILFDLYILALTVLSPRAYRNAH